MWPGVVSKFRWSNVLLGNADPPPIRGGSLCFYRPPGVNTPGLVLKSLRDNKRSGPLHEFEIKSFHEHEAKPPTANRKPQTVQLLAANR